MAGLISREPPTRVLFVDDEEVIRNTFQRVLSRNGIQVTVARSAQEGLMCMDTGPFGVVLSDFYMSDKNGIDFLKEVKQRSPETVRILVSGNGQYDTAISVINQVGLFHFLVKPWDPVDLNTVVKRAMDHYELTVVNRRLTGMFADRVAELGRLKVSLEAEVQERTTNLMSGLINALDFRDTETQSHSRRVALYASRLAEQIGLNENEIVDIARGSLLHDIGKIAVSDTILLKPGKLTEDEWIEMRRHSECGYLMIENIEFLGDARRLVREHHERWDGKGYPRGLKEDKICIGARIFAVIDTYDAMTSNRPYRKALSHEIAVEEIAKMRGTQFDPDITDAWLAIPKSEILTIRGRAENALEDIKIVKKAS